MNASAPPFPTMVAATAASWQRVVPDQDPIPLAKACFARPGREGCAAVYTAGPTIHRDAYIVMAARSSQSLKRQLPFARTVLVLGDSSAIPPQSRDTHAAEIRQCLGDFDEVVHWFDPSLSSLSGLAGIYSGWILKPSMIEASPYRRNVYFDADTLVESAEVASLFAVLQTGAASFFAAPEVLTPPACSPLKWPSSHPPRPPRAGLHLTQPPRPRWRPNLQLGGARL